MLFEPQQGAAEKQLKQKEHNPPLEEPGTSHVQGEVWMRMA